MFSSFELEFFILNNDIKLNKINFNKKTNYFYNYSFSDNEEDNTIRCNLEGFVNHKDLEDNIVKHLNNNEIKELILSEIKRNIESVLEQEIELNVLNYKTTKFDYKNNKLIAKQIKEILKQHPELVNKQFRGDNSLSGHCYVASEVVYHIFNNKNLKPMNGKHENVSHWFIKNIETNEIHDLTSIQFKTPIDYNKTINNKEVFKGCGFQTKSASARSKVVINDLLKIS